MSRKKNLNSYFWLLLIMVVVLSLIGLFFVFEASTVESFNLFGHPYYFVKQQAIWLGVGLSCLLVASLIPSGFWQKVAPFIFFFSLITLLLVFIPGLGLKLNGARRWFMIGNRSFQPVELFKFALVIFYAKWMHQHQRLLPFLFLTLFPAILILLQPDLGSLLIVLAIAFGIFFMAGGKIKWLIVVGAIGCLLVCLIILTSAYRRARVTTFFNPDADPLGASFHIKQITIALGTGGLFGQGIGNSTQKYSYVPEASSDSIFAIIAEEIGFVGASFFLILFLMYFLTIYKIATLSHEKSYASLLSFGLLIWISSQTLLNLAALVALVPLTGVPLPFISYGGSSLVMILFVNGVLLSIAKES